MRALLHVHSSYSHDGEPTLKELMDWGRRRGLDAIFLSEHTNDFDEAKMERLVAECAALDHGGCRLVPGLEFPVRGGFHVLAYGIERFDMLVEPSEVVDFIRDQGGVAVLAHPARYGGRWPGAEVLSRMHGIEAWNARYDGRFLPSGRLVRGCAAWLRRYPHLRLFGGQDLHALSDHWLVTMSIGDATTTEGLARELLAAEARFGSRGYSLCASKPPRVPMLTAMSVLHSSYAALRGLRDRLVSSRPAEGGNRPRQTGGAWRSSRADSQMPGKPDDRG